MRHNIIETIVDRIVLCADPVNPKNVEMCRLSDDMKLQSCGSLEQARQRAHEIIDQGKA